MFNTMVFLTDAINSINYEERLCLAYNLKSFLNTKLLENYSISFFKNKYIDNDMLNFDISQCQNIYLDEDKNGVFRPFNFSALQLLLCLKYLSLEDRIKILYMDLPPTKVDRDENIFDFVQVHDHDHNDYDYLKTKVNLYDVIKEKHAELNDLFDKQILPECYHDYYYAQLKKSEVNNIK